MPLDFPTSPTLNQTYSFGGLTWQWNASGWQVIGGPNDQVRSSIGGITGASVVTNIVAISQANYDAIVSPSATTLYVITG